MLRRPHCARRPRPGGSCGAHDSPRFGAAAGGRQRGGGCARGGPARQRRRGAASLTRRQAGGASSSSDSSRSFESGAHLAKPPCFCAFFRCVGMPHLRHAAANSPPQNPLFARRIALASCGFMCRPMSMAAARHAQSTIFGSTEVSAGHVLQAERGRERVGVCEACMGAEIGVGVRCSMLCKAPHAARIRKAHAAVCAWHGC